MLGGGLLPQALRRSSARSPCFQPGCRDTDACRRGRSRLRMLGPGHYRHLVLPWQRRILQSVRDVHPEVILRQHMCGKCCSPDPGHATNRSSQGSEQALMCLSWGLCAAQAEVLGGDAIRHGSQRDGEHCDSPRRGDPSRIGHPGRSPDLGHHGGSGLGCDRCRFRRGPECFREAQADRT